MNRALEIISLQHELAMAIGNDLYLDSTVNCFLKVCFKRFQLRGIHIFFHAYAEHDDASAPKLQPRHYLSIPQRDKGTSWSESKKLKGWVEESLNSEEGQPIYFDDRYFYLLDVPYRGILIFESESVIAKEMLAALPALLQKFSASCAAATAFETLHREVNSRKLAEQQVFHQANHDSLTQLCNRRKLNEELSKSLKNCKKHGHFGALIFIDLNQFKSINDLMGHKVGDGILKTVGERLTKIKLEKDIVARFGGDEFIYLLNRTSNSEAETNEKVLECSSKIQHVLSHVYTIGDSCYSVGCSMGYEIFSGINQNEIDVIRNADIAMYEAKKRKDLYCLRYSEEMSSRLLHKLHYTRDLKNAVANKEFYLHYQPQVDSIGNLVAAEALLRWNRNNYGPVSPAEYIPIAEESDLIVLIGDWVLKRVFQDARRLYELGLPESFRHFAINISGKQLNQDDFVQKFINLMRRVDIPPSLISIEITENTLISNVEQAIETISALRKIGVDCAIDDFGTGYSSLAYLKKLPVSTIKLDRAFVCNINNDSDNQSIARMVLSLGENFGLNVVSEGIEREEELSCLLTLGCVLFQGFYFYRPIPLEKLIEILD